jgi:hypothetical protein
MTGASYDNFREKWMLFDPEGTGLINNQDLPRLLGQLHPPMGFAGYPSRKNKIMAYIYS